MAATPGFRSRPTADDRIYRAVAAGKSADDVRRAIERSRAVVPGSTAQQQRAAAVNQAGQTGETPLQGNAHRQWRGDLVGLLLENGADTAGLFEARQITPLAVAVAYGLVDTVRALLTAGHDANENFYYKDCTAVHWCVARAPLSPAPNYDYPLNCHPRLNVLKVLEGHADVNARDAYGRTPLHWLDPDDTRDAKNAALDLLVSLGADVNARDKYPLFSLAEPGGSTLAQLQRLMQHGASPDAVDDDGVTPLRIACSCAYDPERRDILLELLRRSSHQTRRGVVRRPGLSHQSSIDQLVVRMFDTESQFEPWHHQVGELLASGAPVLPRNAAPVLPSAAERAQQYKDELAARRSESRRWRARREDVFGLAQDAKEPMGAQQGVEERRALLAALEAELRALGAGETTSSSSSEDDDDDEDKDDESDGAGESAISVEGDGKAGRA